MQQVAYRIYTYDDLATTPDDGKRYEIIGGEVIVSPAPRLAHQDVSRKLVVRLEAHNEVNDLGHVYFAPTDVRFSPYNTVQPDILFVVREREEILRPEYVDGAPDLVVEVLSEGTRRVDLIQKRALYAMAGVPEYWIVDPEERSVTVLRLVDGQYVPEEQADGVARSRVVAGFAIGVAEVFADLD